MWLQQHHRHHSDGNDLQSVRFCRGLSLAFSAATATTPYVLLVEADKLFVDNVKIDELHVKIDKIPSFNAWVSPHTCKLDPFRDFILLPFLVA